MSGRTNEWDGWMEHSLPLPSFLPSFLLEGARLTSLTWIVITSQVQHILLFFFFTFFRSWQPLKHSLAYLLASAVGRGGGGKERSTVSHRYYTGEDMYGTQ